MIHGFKGEPNGGWRPWLMGELARNEVYACSLPMPTPDTPNKDEWTKTISDAVGKPSEEIFLVGHSLGVPAILRYIESLDEDSRIGGALLISGPFYEIKKDGYEHVNSFLDTPINFEYINNICHNFSIIHGDNDQNVPYDEAIQLAKELRAELISIPNGGHLNGSSGWYQLPQALDALLKMIKE